MSAFYLKPYTWNLGDDDGLPFTPGWEITGAPISALDCRTFAAMAASGGDPEGYALVEYPALIIDPEAIFLGDDPLGHMSVDTRRSMATALGFGRNDLNGANTLDRAVWRVLTQLADPTGVNAVKPLMPDTRLRMRLNFGGVSHNERFTEAVHPRVYEVERLDYQRNKTFDIARGSNHYKRYLDATCIQYRTDPAGLGLPGEERLPRGTKIGDTMVQPTTNTVLASHTATGPDGGHSWSEVLGSITVYEATDDAQNPNGENVDARADADLSSANHYSEANVTILVSDSRQVGVAVRFKSDAEDFYTLQYRDGTSSPDAWQISKVVAGTKTGLTPTATEATKLGDNPGVIRLEINGNDLEGFLDTVSKITVTDTTITGNLRTGIGLANPNGALRAIWDDFEAADLAAAAVSSYPAWSRRRPNRAMLARH